ncbi:hypothetical protein FQR65_LT15966 [Abscondita terminalis]|nr:hypothetical protein FQR65_LT15966 [Abscondita terminalis]
MLEQFDPEEEDFSSYKERLDNFLSMRGIGSTDADDATKRSILLGCLKRTQFQQLAAMTAPDKPSEKSYLELVFILISFEFTNLQESKMFSSEELNCTPPEIRDAANTAIKELLPGKSKISNRVKVSEFKIVLIEPY